MVLLVEHHPRLLCVVPPCVSHRQCSLYLYHRVPLLVFQDGQLAYLLVGFATVIEKGEGLMRTSLWNYFDIIGISYDEDDDEDDDDGDDGAAWLAGKLSLFSSCLAAT